MIKTPTVFVLGAGASIPYGYPSGETLKHIICKELNSSKTGNFIQILNMGYEKEWISEFRNALFHSPTTSVDAFLEHRKEFIEVGKVAIAQALIPFESTDNLFILREGDWYKYLFGKLNAPFDEFGENKISILTFNYDRSLEHYLFTALMNLSSGKNTIECANKLKEIPIIHLYGKLGSLPFEDDNCISFDIGSPNIDQLKLASKGIKIISEDITNDNEFNKALELLIEANRIYFIGFGYNKINVERLRFSSVPADHHKNKAIMGTAVNLSREQQYNVKHQFSQMHIQIGLRNQYAYDFIRDVPLK